MHDFIKHAIPTQLRETRYMLKRLGPVKYARYRGLERVERRKPPPRAGEPFDLGGGSIVLHDSTVHSVLTHWVEYGHGIRELHAFKRLAPGHRLFLDIGAAEGIFSAAFCSLTGSTSHAFEPSPEMFERLEALCDLNPSFAINATNIALGASAGARPVRQYTDGQFSGVGAAAAEAEVMAVTSLDAFVEQHAIQPDLAKIDVEGMEMDVLRGGERTFRETVTTIFMEVHYALLAQLGQSTSELQFQLADYGFLLETLDGDRIDDLTNYVQAEPEVIPGYTIIVCRKPSV